MYKTIGMAAVMLGFATGGTAMLGGTAPASSGPGTVATPTTCVYTVYFWGYKWVIPAPCPASDSSGSAASNSGPSATSTNGYSR